MRLRFRYIILYSISRPNGAISTYPNSFFAHATSPVTVQHASKQNTRGDGHEQDTTVPHDEVRHILIDTAELQHCYTQQAGDRAQRAPKNGGGESNAAP